MAVVYAAGMERGASADLVFDGEGDESDDD
jgi:hypothetical protein